MLDDSLFFIIWVTLGYISWDPPLLSSEGSVPCLVKQHAVLIGFELMPDKQTRDHKPDTLATPKPSLWSQPVFYAIGNAGNVSRSTKQQVVLAGF